MTVLTRQDALELKQAQGFDIIIPDTFTSIEDRAFSNTLLTSVVIPDSVTSIGFAAFEVNRLSSVVIPDSVTSIGANAFANN